MVGEDSGLEAELVYLGNIIFTTRDRKAAVKLAFQNVIELSEMNEENEETAKGLLKKCLINPNLADSDGTKDLLVQLTYLLLAIAASSSLSVRLADDYHILFPRCG
jgi:hypothetical protein